MIHEICRHIRNFFPDTDKQITGTFVIANGTCSPFPTIPDGQYYLIEGSSLNDGVYNGQTTLRAETFKGTITPMKCPREFLDLVAEIESYHTKYTETPFNSESFGGYSYSKDPNASWQNAYATRLNSWRKV